MCLPFLFFEHSLFLCAPYLTSHVPRTLKSSLSPPNPSAPEAESVSFGLAYELPPIPISILILLLLSFLPLTLLNLPPSTFLPPPAHLQGKKVSLHVLKPCLPLPYHSFPIQFCSELDSSTSPTPFSFPTLTSMINCTRCCPNLAPKGGHRYK